MFVRGGLSAPACGLCGPGRLATHSHSGARRDLAIANPESGNVLSSHCIGIPGLCLVGSADLRASRNDKCVANSNDLDRHVRQALDLAEQHVALHDRADVLRRAGIDDVAGLQLEGLATASISARRRSRSSCRGPSSASSVPLTASEIAPLVEVTAGLGHRMDRADRPRHRSKLLPISHGFFSSPMPRCRSRRVMSSPTA